jgi:putative peptide zinc metalloprotease protein
VSAIFSEHWYRVAHLHPRLRSHVQVDRHCYRGEIWHVLKDPISGRQHRMNPLGYRIVARLDGRMSVQQIWDQAVVDAGDDAPTQPDVMALLAQLHNSELIQTEATPDVDDMFDRADTRRGRERRQRLNPLSMRVALLDPTRWLDAGTPLAAWVLRRWALWAWLALVSTALVLLAPRAATLGAYAALHLSTPRMLLTLWLAYPLIKALHELAHAFAVRVWGGEVHEMGISLLMLMPVPYVDASSAAGFRERHRRVLVSLMGILAETTLAALAALLWLNVSDGMLREAAFATMLIGGVSTLLFNGNPLLRFDAYHALADAIESPGLAPRSDAYWRYLGKRYLMGAALAQPPTMAPGERRWLFGYGLASGVYRVIVSITVVGWLAGLNLVLGVGAGLWLLATMLMRPAYRLVRYARSSPELRGQRARASAVAAWVVLVPLVLVFAVPVPERTRAEGVVWAPEQAQVRSQEEGTVEQVAAQDGQQLAAGDVILQLRNPVLDTELERVEARLRGLEVAYYNLLFNAPAQAGGVAQERRIASAERERIAARISALTVRSTVVGRVALRHAQDLPGTFLPRGALVAHVLAPGAASVRVLVSQADVARVQMQAGRVDVRLADDPATSLRAKLLAQTPAATRQLPSAAFGDRGGGGVVTDASDAQGLRALEPLFALDLQVPQRALDRIGGRAWARFDHGSRPLAEQWWRRLQQLLVGELSA